MDANEISALFKDLPAASTDTAPCPLATSTTAPTSGVSSPALLRGWGNYFRLLFGAFSQDASQPSPDPTVDAPEWIELDVFSIKHSFRYPDGSFFEVDEEWLIEAGIYSRTHGMQCDRGNDTYYAYQVPVNIDSGQEVRLEKIGNFQKPQRVDSFTPLLEKESLIQILKAFKEREKLPVAAAEQGYGLSMDKLSGRPIIVNDGFHRFHASIIYGYLEFPVLINKQVMSSSEKSTGPRWRPKRLRDGH